jgi:hypothetical protein
MCSVAWREIHQTTHFGSCCCQWLFDLWQHYLYWLKADVLSYRLVYINEYSQFCCYIMLGWLCISNHINNNKLDALLSSVYWVITPLHVSGVSAAHHQEVEFIYVANGTCCISELTVSGPGWNGTGYVGGSFPINFLLHNQIHSNQAHQQSTQKYNKYHLPHINILPPEDGRLIRPKHVEVW